MAQVYHFKPPRQRRPSRILTCDRLAVLALVVGTLAAWFAGDVAMAGDLATPIGLGVVFAVYAGLFRYSR